MVPRDTSRPSLFRDGDLLVIDVRNAHFPDRCLKSNEPVDDSRQTLVLEVRAYDGDAFRTLAERQHIDKDPSGFPFRTTAFPSFWMQSSFCVGASTILFIYVLFGTMPTVIRMAILTAAILTLAVGLPLLCAQQLKWKTHRSTLAFRLALPLSADWQQQTLRSNGGCLMGGGIAAAVTCLVPLGMSFEATGTISAWPLVAAAVFLAVAACGFLMRFRQESPVLRAVHYRHGYLWIEGVNPEFVEELPTWNTSNEARGAMNNLAYQSIAFWGILSFVFMVVLGTSVAFMQMWDWHVDDEWYLRAIAIASGVLATMFLLIAIAQLRRIRS